MSVEKRIIKDSDFNSEEFKEWEKTVNIVRYEHDFEKQQRVIDFNPLSVGSNPIH